MEIDEYSLLKDEARELRIDRGGRTQVLRLGFFNLKVIA